MVEPTVVGGVSVQGDEASDKAEARDVALDKKLDVAIDKKLDVALVSSKRTFQKYVGCVRHWMSYREASSSR